MRLAAPLRDPVFRMLLVGQSTSVLMQRLAVVVLSWGMVESTGAARLAGLTLTVNALGRIVATIPGGVLADRVSPGHLLSTTALARIIIVLSWLLVGNSSSLTPFTAAVIFGGLGIVSGLSAPTVGASVPRILSPDKIASGNAVFFGALRVCGVAGALAGGVGIAAVGPLAVLYGIVALSAFIAAAFLRIRSDLSMPSNRKVFSKTSPSIGTARVIFHDRTIVGLLLLMLGVGLAIPGPFMIGLSKLTTDLGHGPQVYGFFVAAWTASSLLGTSIAGAYAWRRKRLFLLSCSAVLGSALISIGSLSQWTIVVLLVFAAGLMQAICETLIISWMQLRIAQAFMGRATGVFFGLWSAATTLSYTATGFIADWSLPSVYYLAGTLMLGITVLVVSAGMLRQQSPERLVHATVSPTKKDIWRGNT